MAKLRGKIPPRTIAAFRGVVDVYHHVQYGWIARAWPRPHRPCNSPAYLASVQRMREGWQIAKQATELDKARLSSWAQSTPKTTIDLIGRSVMSAPDDRFQFFTDPQVVWTDPSPTSVGISIQKPDSVLTGPRDAPATYLLASGSSESRKLPPLTPGPPGPCPSATASVLTRFARTPNQTWTPVVNQTGNPWLSAVVETGHDKATFDCILTGDARTGPMRLLTPDMPRPSFAAGWYCTLVTDCADPLCSIGCFTHASECGYCATQEDPPSSIAQSTAPTLGGRRANARLSAHGPRSDSGTQLPVSAPSRWHSLPTRATLPLAR